MDGTEEIKFGKVSIPTSGLIIVGSLIGVIITFGISGIKLDFSTSSAGIPKPSGFELQSTCADNASGAYLGWTISENATSYTVQRKENTELNWQNISERLSSGNTAYYDTAVRQDTFYTYRVRAQNKTGHTHSNESAIFLGALECSSQ